MIGGFRLSLGYRQIMAAQADKANSVISKLLMSKPLDNDDKKQNKEAKNGTEMRGLARLAIAMDRKEKDQQQKNGIHHAQVNGVKKAGGSVKSVHPEVDIKTSWKMTSTDELRTLDYTTALQSSRLASSLDKCSVSSSDCSNARNVSNVSTKEQITVTATNEQLPATGNQLVDFTKKQVTMEKEQGSISKKDLNIEMENDKSRPDKKSNASNASRTGANDDNQANAISKLLAQENEHTNTMAKEKVSLCEKPNKTVKDGGPRPCDSTTSTNEERGQVKAITKLLAHKNEQSNVSNSLSATQKQDTKKQENNNNIDQIKKSQSTADIPDEGYSSVSCSSALTRRWNSDRHIKRDDKKKNKKSQLEQILGSGLDEMTLDAVGLEVKQWENVVSKPKQWHYCWHILRKDMIPVHNAKC